MAFDKPTVAVYQSKPLNQRKQNNALPHQSKEERVHAPLANEKIHSTKTHQNDTII